MIAIFAGFTLLVISQLHLWEKAENSQKMRPQFRSKNSRCFYQISQLFEFDLSYFQCFSYFSQQLSWKYVCTLIILIYTVLQYQRVLDVNFPFKFSVFVLTLSDFSPFSQFLLTCFSVSEGFLLIFWWISQQKLS